MALLTIDEFASKCVMPRRALMVYINPKRGTVIADGEIIDTNHPKNIAFFNKREAKGLTTPKGIAPKKVNIPREETYIEPRPFKIKTIEGDGEEADYEEDEHGILPLPVSQQRKLHYEAKVQERTVTLKDLDIQKKSGQTVPTISIVALMSETLRLFAIGYRDLYEREVQKIAAMADFSAKELADIRNSGINNINLVYENAIEQAKKSIDAIVAESSVKRGVGEKT